MQYQSITFGVLFALFSFAAYSDEVKIGAVVLDDVTSMPMSDVEVCFSFTEDIGWRAWTESTPHHKMYCRTDSKGRCQMTGTSNCGQGGCHVKNPPMGYYRPAIGWKHNFTEKNLFGVWQPDNLVATIRLQRVEHPIPLWVKQVELHDFERGIGGFDGTNSVLRFDLMKGDWLPPYGNGEVADMCVTSRVEITGTGKHRKIYHKRREDGKYFGWESRNFYELKTTCSVLPEDGIAELVTDPNAGIRIRSVLEDPEENGVQRKRGEVQVFLKDREGWCVDRINDANHDRCYTFRIRSRRNEKGELVEAYYGKIYGDFAFEGDDKRGLIGVRFLYYLNPKPLDRNLEWDMKTNLCPDSGNLGMLQP